MHLRAPPSISTEECGAPLFSFFSLDSPVTAVSISAGEDVAVVVVRERLLQDLMRDDVSVGILMVLGKSVNESSMNCDSHSSSATSSLCKKKKKKISIKTF